MSDDQSAESVIWIASYPKSGNTWVKTVIRTAGKSYGFPAADIDVYSMIAEKRKPKVVGGIQPEIMATRAAVLKTHGRIKADGEVHPKLGLKTVGFVYIMRNPLDVLLSYINFTRLQYEKKKEDQIYRERLFQDLLGFNRTYTYDEWLQMPLENIPKANLDHALERFTELNMDIPAMSGFTGGSWLEHCISWCDAGKCIPAVYLRYEDLLADSQSFLALKKLFTFTDAEIVNAVNTMTERQRNLQHSNIFYNKMSSHYYRDFFSLDVMQCFLKKFEGELKLLGYADLYS